MEKKKNDWLLYLCIALFGIVGIYLLFIRGNTSKYDSKTRAYRIYDNADIDSDGNTTYYPIYYFSVDGKEYECKTSGGSSSSPNEDNNMVYYDSKNPNNCKTEYEKSSGRLAGIICLVVSAGLTILIFKKPSNKTYDDVPQDINPNTQLNVDPEEAIKVVEKVSVIYKRIILGIIIIVLLVLILIDTAIFKQTIKARNYIETTATYVDRKTEEDDKLFDDCIYTFTDKDGNTQEVIVSVSRESEPKESIKVKYNENNPQEYYEEGATLDKSGMILYGVKVLVMILLIVLFFNKKLLSRVNISNN